MTMALPTSIIEILPTLKALSPSQKLQIIHTLSNENDNLSEKSANDEYENLAWEKGKDLFGSYHSGRSDLSANAKVIAKQRIREISV